MKKEKKTQKDPRRDLASVNDLLLNPEIQVLAEKFSRPIVVDTIRETLALLRKEIKKGKKVPDINGLISKIKHNILEKNADQLRPVINATGIILHTGLGRAVLPEQATKALSGLDQCCNLQIDMKTGQRGKRNYMTEQLLCRITNAEAALIVNNNAAATFLILSALCKNKEVIISRGQLIEIGGSFRLPDCIHQSGAVMNEVGTTNKTHLRDYENALNENTGMILRAHPSNYKIIGFSKEVPIEELVLMKKKQDVIVVDDLGCGALIDLSEYGLPKEPTVQESISAGADLACFSGDKLISGPQAGIIVGKKKLIDIIRKHPLTRMLRVGKLTDIALENTLRLYLEPDKLINNSPVLQMLTVQPDTLKIKAQKIKNKIIKEKITVKIDIEKSHSHTGGGSLPGLLIPTYTLTLSSEKHSAGQINEMLKQNEPPVIARVNNDKVYLDMRTLLKNEDNVIAAAIITIFK